MLTLPVVSSPRRSLSMEPPPVSLQDLGLPDKFRDWRPAQWDATERILGSDKRFVILCAPTGMGKTIVGVAASLLSGDRTVMLTATKGLQDQASGDFATLSSDIRGLSNYLCPITNQLGIPRNTTVDQAPCQFGYGCARRRGGCEFYDRYRIAQESNLVVTNYQMWMNDGAKEESDRGDLQYGMPVTGCDLEQTLRAEDRRRVKLLICDEAHSIEDSLSLFLGVDLSRHECLAMRIDWPDSGLTVDQWRDWASAWMPKIESRVEQSEARVKSSQGRSWSKEHGRLRDLKRKLERLSGMQSDDGWIANETDVQGRSMTGIRFDPLNPARYAEQVLWRGIEKIVLVSATVRPKTAELLGIANEDLEFCEYPSSFDPKRRPTVYIPSERMTFKSEQDDQKMRWWLNRFDALVEKNLHHKGLVHCVSYRRMKFIYDNSQYREHMLIHNSHDRSSVIEAFRRRDPPAILLSPSVDTGYDFPNDQSRWMIVAKLPFASVQDKVIKARQELDKEYGMYLAAQTLVQMAGRAMRSETDYAACYIMDGNWEWFQGRARKYFPRWFQEAIQWWDKPGMPDPLAFDEPCAWCGKGHEGGPEYCPE